MTELATKHCEACRVGAPKVSDEEAKRLLNDIPEWHLVSESGIHQLQRQFTFSNFVEALAFTNAVGELAESENHHPAITTEWGKVLVCWWTHKIKGLHRNDFIMAAKTDAAFAQL